MKTTIPQSRPKGARYACTACGAGVMGVHEFAAHDAVCPVRTAAANVSDHPHRIRTGTPSATLPDPWTGYLVAFTHADVTRRHAIRDSATVNGKTVFCPAGGFSEDVYLDWTPDVVQEVRTPDGATVWKRPAAKVTT